MLLRVSVFGMQVVHGFLDLDIIRPKVIDCF